MRYYKTMRDNAIVQMDNGELMSAPAIMTQLLRLQQILCGHVILDNGDRVEFETNRTQALMQTIEEMTGKVIIWSRFRYDIRKIQSMLAEEYGPGSVVTYFGDTSDDDRQEAIRKFQYEEGVRFFVGNPQTAGMGLTLHAATNVIYYANDFNLQSRIQSEDRCHRIGQNNHVTYVDLISPGTVDKHIVENLQDKIKLSAKSLGEEVRQWLELTP